MPKETTLYQSLRKNISQVHWQRIESPMTQGTPDVNGCIQAKEFWLELKIARGNKIKFSNFQCNWAQKRITAGGKVFALIQHNKNKWIRLYHGLQFKGLQEQGLSSIQCILEIEPTYEEEDWNLLLKNILT
tara:strand:+ start:200 stop:592 length:393 start_codon:yes stop_codon:yes gene_type:complete